MRNIYALFLIIAISGILLVVTVAPTLAQTSSSPGVIKSEPGVVKYVNPGKTVGQVVTGEGVKMFCIPECLFKPYSDKVPSYKPCRGDTVTFTNRDGNFVAIDVRLASYGSGQCPGFSAYP